MNRWRPLVRRDLRLATAAGAFVGAMVIAQAWLVADILHRGLVDKAPTTTLASAFLLLATVVVLRAGGSFLAERQGLRAGFAVVSALRLSLYDRFDKAGPTSLADKATGEWVALVGDASRAVEPYFSRYIPATAQAAVLPIGILVVVAPLDWMSGLALAVTAPLIPVFMVLIGKGAEALNQRQWLRLQWMSGHFLDALRGLATLKAFNAGARKTAEVADVAEGYRRDTMGVLRVAFLSSLTLEFFASVSIAIVAVLVGFRLLWGELEYRDGLFILLLAPEFYLPLRAMGSAYHARMESLGAAARLADIEALEETGFPPTASEPVAGSGSAEIGIAFDDVHLRFADGRTALDGVTLTVAPGEAVALVGASGAGKSSILALCLGILTPTDGTVRINGTALDAATAADLRSRVAYVPQNPTVFAETLAANVALGDRDPDLGRIAVAIRRAGLAEVADRLPLQTDTPIGDGGIGLSGGEIQRIGLARAFYRDASLVVLDEPTAHLDAATEEHIQEAIGQLRQGRTMIFVAHRLRTLAHADRIVVVEAGRVAETGPPDELAAAGGAFARLIRAAGGEASAAFQGVRT